MMRTEDDLRAALSGLEAQAPDTHAVLPPAVRRAGTGRRTLLLAGAAAAVAVAVPVTARRFTGRDVAPGAAGPRHPWQLGFAPALAGHRICRLETSATVQQVKLMNQDDTLMVTLTVHDPGRYDPTVARVGVPVSVHGHDGFYLNLIDDGRGVRLSGVAWEYARDSWAVLQGGDEDESLGRAREVRFDAVTALRVPFWVDAELPAGLRPGGGREQHAVAGVLPVSSAQLELADPGGGMLRIDAMPWDGVLRPGSGARARRFGEFGVAVTAGRLSAAELDRILDSVTPCPDYADRATWFDASAAVTTAG